MLPSFISAGLIGLFVQITTAAPPYPHQRHLCNTINGRFPGKVGFANSTQFEDSQQHYFAADAREVIPTCVFRPTSTNDVAEFVKLATAHIPHVPYGNGSSNSPGSKPLFAVRSGGHTLWKGAANAQDGVTVDMRSIDSFTLSKDKKVASVGGGINFGKSVYPNLVQHNLTIIGARLTGVAAGGFLTGGGKNFLARRHGFGCDNIHGYEVVLASGQVVYASAAHNRDLWLALKGGSNNFGIVTRYDLATYHLEQMWGGVNSIEFSSEALDHDAQAFHDFMRNENFDDAADVGILLGFVQGNFFLQNTMWYSEPVADPPCFRNFTKNPRVTSSALHFNDVATVVRGDGLVVPDNIGRSFELVFTFKNADPATYRSLFKVWQDEISKIRTVEGLQIQYLLQPMPVTNGTNSIGLPANGKDVAMWVLTAGWNKVTDDDAVVNALRSIFDQSEVVLKRLGLNLPLRYLNYADVTQDPISTYGKKNIDRLWAASKKYDPKGLWQKHVPGYKLPKQH